MRDATHDDIPAMVALGKLMHSESPTFCHLSWDGDKVAKTIAGLIDSPMGFAVVVESDGEITGGMMAVAVPHWCSSDLAACDLALFVRPDRRGGIAAARLLESYRVWAERIGCKLTQFGVMTGVNVDQTEALCARLGWKRQGVVLCA